MPQTILLFGGPDSLRRNQVEKFRETVGRNKYECQTFNAHTHDKKQKSVEYIVCSVWDLFITDNLGNHFEEAKQIIDLLLAIPGNRVSAIMIKSSSGCKSYDACTKELWRYLQMECPSVGVYNMPGASTPEDVHKKVMHCINVNNVPENVHRFPYHRHD